jgi:hypothetical protein
MGLWGNALCDVLLHGFVWRLMATSVSLPQFLFLWSGLALFRQPK